MRSLCGAGGVRWRCGLGDLEVSPPPPTWPVPCLDPSPPPPGASGAESYPSVSAQMGCP